MATAGEVKKKTKNIPGISMVRKRSATVCNVVFTNRQLFPSIVNLPDEDYPHRQYYRSTIFGSKFVPIRPWYFLGEITNARNAQNSWLRYRILVTDIDGNQGINIDSYTKDPPFDYSTIKQGHTICVRFGARHRFLDGTMGVRVEQFKKVYVFPVPLGILMSTVSDEIKENLPIHLRDKPCEAEVLTYVLSGKGGEIPYESPPPHHCWQCKMIESEEHKMKTCGRCGVAKYCQKECQVEHWKASHKHSCKCLIIYTTMVDNTKTALDNMAQYLDAFVSTDEDDSKEDDNDEEKVNRMSSNSSDSFDYYD
jgi:hypothetical protein